MADPLVNDESRNAWLDDILAASMRDVSHGRESI